MRKIILITSNDNKLEAYNKQFSLYGIGVQVAKNLNSAKALFSKSEDFIAIMWDESNLYNRESRAVSSKDTDMELVYNLTRLDYITREHQGFLTSKPTEGYIDLSKKIDDSSWWDDIFVLSSVGKTFKELHVSNMKNSGREELISKFIMNELYYKDKIDLNFNPQSQDRTIVFNGKSVDFIRNNEYLNTPSNEPFRNLFNLSLNNGAFFRSAKNRREKNYWVPGLNAGIPLVPKRDSVHEITFAVHDLCHFIMPDLIFDGLYDQDETHKKVYIIHRMMSEAITMVLADMVFIDGLKKDGIDYDFSKRKIYPLYEKIKHHSLKDIMYANVSYCLRGSDKEYRRLLDNKNLDVLEDFKEKYGPFFVEDYKWTIRNYENMCSDIQTFLDWSLALTAEMRDNNLVRIGSFMEKVDSNNLIDSIFEEVTENIYFPAMQNGKAATKESNVSNSFKKYMIGQMHIFYKFKFVPVSHTYSLKLKDYLSKEILSDDDMKLMRGLYEDYLSQLLSMNLINDDDFETYKETYPIFDSFFVFYDKNKDYYESIESICRNVLGESECK